MRTHIALLRGINLGGKNKVAMSDLRQVVSSLGHLEVETYIQSGNVAFTAVDDQAGAFEMANALEVAIAQRLNVKPAVIVVSRDNLSQVIASNPFVHESNPKAVHAIFLKTEASSEHRAAVEAAVERARAKGSRDQAQAIGNALYLWTPEGFGRSILATELTRSKSAASTASGTARNWTTVMALVQLLDR